MTESAILDFVRARLDEYTAAMDRIIQRTSMFPAPGVQPSLGSRGDLEVSNDDRLADDLEADAQEFDPDTPTEGGLVEGLGRAAGKARARADESGKPPDRERVVLAVRRLSDALEEKYPGEFVGVEDLRLLVDWARWKVEEA